MAASRAAAVAAAIRDEEPAEPRTLETPRPADEGGPGHPARAGKLSGWTPSVSQPRAKIASPFLPRVSSSLRQPSQASAKPRRARILPNSHPPLRRHARPWHRGSEFGDGLRFPLDREQRCVWRVRLDLARRAGRITALHALVGEALLRRQGRDGRCDPAHDTLAEDAGCCPRTVRTALKALFELGMLRWVNRLVRVGDHVEQTSNAYTFIVAAAAAFVPRPRRKSPCATSGGKSCPQTHLNMIQNTQLAAVARQALAEVRLQFEKKWLGKAASAKIVPV